MVVGSTPSGIGRFNIYLNPWQYIVSKLQMEELKGIKKKKTDRERERRDSNKYSVKHNFLQRFSHSSFCISSFGLF